VGLLHGRYHEQIFEESDGIIDVGQCSYQLTRRSIMYKVVVKEVTDGKSEYVGKYKVVEMVNNVRYSVGQHISRDEVKALAFKPSYSVVVR
jgi:hypothetical protein